MTIRIDVPDQQLSEKIIWLLKRFKSDGVKITMTNDNKESISTNNKALDTLASIVQTKSKDSILLDDRTVLHPHVELSHDIS